MPKGERRVSVYFNRHSRASLPNIERHVRHRICPVQYFPHNRLKIFQNSVCNYALSFVRVLWTFYFNVLIVTCDSHMHVSKKWFFDAFISAYKTVFQEESISTMKLRNNRLIECKHVWLIDWTKEPSDLNSLLLIYWFRYF